MDTREQADFARNLADVGRAAPVGTLAFGQNHVSKLLFDNFIGGFFEVGDVVGVFSFQCINDLINQERQTGFTRRFIRV